MPVLQHPNATAGVLHTDYEWRYEYYDEEEPVSFEGLRAHKCKSCLLLTVNRVLALILILSSKIRHLLLQFRDLNSSILVVSMCYVCVCLCVWPQSQSCIKQ